MTAFVDASIIVCHLTGDPPGLAHRATELFTNCEPLLVADIVLVDVAEILEFTYGVDRHFVSTALRSLLAYPSVECVDRAVLLRGIAVYEIDGLRLSDAFVVALAESTGVDRVASFNRSFERPRTIERVA